MRAIVIESPSRERPVMGLAEAPEPVTGPGDVLVEVAFGGCNYADTMMRSGVYPHPKGYPLVAGIEFAGIVGKVGAGVRGIAVGDRVSAFSEGAGGFAERCAVPAERVVRLPDSISLRQGAAFYIQGMTAWCILHLVSTTRPGDTILLHAAGGGLGLFVVQLAKAAGARLIGTVGTPGKEARPLAFGADAVVNRAEGDFVAVALAFTEGRGVDKIVDSTGATILDRSFAALRRLGHVVSVGEAEGKPLPNLWERLVERSATFTRLHVGHVDFRSDAWQRGVSDVLGGIAEGRFHVPVEEVYPFAEAGAMMDRLLSRRVSGKLLLEVSGG
ncbi:MAG: zinc-binding dehydrogenase [Alsobacter sp.]